MQASKNGKVYGILELILSFYKMPQGLKPKNYCFAGAAGVGFAGCVAFVGAV